MSDQALYVYAIGRGIPREVDAAVDAIDGSHTFHQVEQSGLSAVYTPVEAASFAQEEIDRRSGDLEWIGQIGYRHQTAVSHFAAHASVIPLRAFTLFRSEDSLAEYLRSDERDLKATLEKIDGKDEWTFTIELDAERWRDAVVQRVESLRLISGEITTAPAGKAYLLKKKLEEEKKKAAREAEQDLVREIESALWGSLNVPAIVENRLERKGSFPQIHLLVGRSQRRRLEQVHADLAGRYEPEGVTLRLTGPWPPYTFVASFRNG